MQKKIEYLTVKCNRQAELLLKKDSQVGMAATYTIRID